MKYLLRKITGAERQKEARADYIRSWSRSPGSDDDVWEAHTALEHLEKISHRERWNLEESEEWLVANACVAETMSYISWLQEWKVREAVAAG
ncbi:MAG: hypothetical protein ACRDTJ_30195, partial [Pseudonocardiaceae bacterium]